MRNSLLFILMLVMLGSLQAQQPYGGVYHPEHLKTWVPGQNPNDVFNRASVSLQPRFEDKNIKANVNTSFSPAQVAACLTLAKDCSKGFSQGKNSFDEMYTFDYWQYVDMVVWWGGSAGEGVFICPTASAIDAAHRNGTKILGNIFFAPSVYGGMAEWVTQTLEKDDNGKYIIADKLIEMANYFGFDGWFLNEETKHFSDKEEWTKFLKYYTEHSNGLEIQVYNASSTFGESNSWTLRDSEGNVTGTSYFVDYGGTGSVDAHTTFATSLGIDKYDLYYGINNGSSAFGSNAAIHAIMDQSKASLQLFIERSLFRLGTSGDAGNDAYDLTAEKIESFFNTSSKYWSGGTTVAEHNPSIDRKTQAWSGLANMTPSRSTIQNKPFITNFNSGYGVMRNIDGVDKGVSKQRWTHQAMQDMLPTWRWWWVDDANKELTARLSLADAYNGGTSVLIEGNLKASDANDLNLYKTKLAIENGDKFRFVFKNAAAGASNVKVGLTFTDNYATPVYIDVPNATGAWDKVDLDLSAYAGKTLAMISLRFESATAQTVKTYIGQLGVYSSAALTMGTVANIKSQKELGPTSGDLRLTWDAASGDVLYYNIYLERNGSKVLAGQTPSTAFYIPEFKRTSPEETSLVVSVVPVSKLYVEGTAATVTKNWQTLPAPDVKIVASTTYTKTGTNVKLIAKATNFPTTYTWTKPSGATQVYLNKDTVVYSFAAEGTYDVTVKVDNKDNSTTKTISKLLTINNTTELSNVALKKTIADHNGHYGSEAPEKLIDGITNQGGSEKWCYGGSKEHFVTIDLGDIFDIYYTRFLDGPLNESGAPTIKYYKTLVSMTNNGNDWVELYNETDRAADTIKVDHFAGVKARFVKFMPYDPNDGITIRVWEYEVYGKAVANAPKLQAVDNKVIALGKTIVSLPYELGTGGQASDFAVKVDILSGNESIAIENVKSAEGKITFDLTGVSYGLAFVYAELTNNGMVSAQEFSVAVENPFWANLALNQKLYKVGAGTYGNEFGKTSNAVDGVDSTWWCPELGVYSFALNLGQECYVYKTLVSFKTGVGSYPTYCKIPEKVKVSYSTDSVNWESTEAAVVNNELIVRFAKIKVKYMVFETNLQNYNFYALNEVRVIGSEMNGKPAYLGEIAAVSVEKSKTKAVETNYALGEDGAKEDFKVTVEATDGASLIEIADIVAANGKISFNVNGIDMGEATVEVKITNDGASLSQQFKVTVSEGSSVNDEATNGLELSAFPTVFTNSLEITFKLVDRQNVNIALYNAIGAKVAEVTNDVFSNGNHKVQLNNAANIESGVYYLRLDTQSGSKTVRVIKQ